MKAKRLSVPGDQVARHRIREVSWKNPQDYKTENTLAHRAALEEKL